MRERSTPGPYFIRRSGCGGNAGTRSKQTRRSPPRRGARRPAPLNSRSSPGGEAPLPRRCPPPPPTQRVTFNALSRRPSPQAAGRNTGARPTPPGNAPPASPAAPGGSRRPRAEARRHSLGPALPPDQPRPGRPPTANPRGGRLQPPALTLCSSMMQDGAEPGPAAAPGREVEPLRPRRPPGRPPRPAPPPPHSACAPGCGGWGPGPRACAGRSAPPSPVPPPRTPAARAPRLPARGGACGHAQSQPTAAPGGGAAAGEAAGSRPGCGGAGSGGCWSLRAWAGGRRLERARAARPGRQEGAGPPRAQAGAGLRGAGTGGAGNPETPGDPRGSSGPRSRRLPPAAACGEAAPCSREPAPAPWASLGAIAAIAMTEGVSGWVIVLCWARVLV